MIVQVVDYCEQWPAEYEKEAAQIKRILSGELVAIHHIGSTAVKGLAAKPVIDIMPVVRNIAMVDGRQAAFEALGYECMGEFGIPGRRYFRKGGEHRTHQIHIFESSNQKDIVRHLAVRDYLRAHPEQTRAYGELKRSLAQKYPEDIESYCDGKDAFVKQMEKEALCWYHSIPHNGTK